MYEASFGLGRAPFRLLPDPRFYLDEGQYGRLLAQLIAALEAGEPYLLLTGPSGSGKTAAVQRLLMLLARTKWTAGAMFASADATGADVLHAVAYAFSLARTDTPPGPAIDAWLSEQTARGSRVLLVIDEAEHLDEGALRQLAERLAPSKGAPGLHLCLVSEQVPPALASAVRDESLPPLAVHCHLRALDANETRDYVLHRLRCAGWNGRPAFDRAATDAIHRRSEGLPRRIHLLADRVLLQLSLADADVATAASVETAADGRTFELQGRGPRDALPADNITVSTRPGRPDAAQPHVPKAAAQRRQAAAPVDPRADSPVAASFTALSGGPAPSRSESALPDSTPFARTASAPAAGAFPRPAAAPKGAASHIRKAAAGAMVLALAGIGIAGWLGVGRAVAPPAAPGNPALESAQSTIAEPAPVASGEAAAPAGGTEVTAATAAGAADPAPVAQTAPAASSVPAEPEPMAGPTPSAAPEGAAPPPVTPSPVTAAVEGGTGESAPTPLARPEPNRITSASPGRDRPPRSERPGNVRRAAGPSQGAVRRAGEPRPSPSTSVSNAAETSASPRSAASPALPQSSPCTGPAAALGLCEAAAPRAQPAPPPVRMATPAAGAASPAAPSAPCEPSRVALGLCER